MRGQAIPSDGKKLYTRLRRQEWLEARPKILAHVRVEPRLNSPVNPSQSIPVEHLRSGSG